MDILNSFDQNAWNELDEASQIASVFKLSNDVITFCENFTDVQRTNVTSSLESMSDKLIFALWTRVTDVGVDLIRLRSAHALMIDFVMIALDSLKLNIKSPDLARLAMFNVHGRLCSVTLDKLGLNFEIAPEDLDKRP